VTLIFDKVVLIVTHVSICTFKNLYLVHNKKIILKSITYIGNNIF